MNQSTDTRRGFLGRTLAAAAAVVCAPLLRFAPAASKPWSAAAVDHAAALADSPHCRIVVRTFQGRVKSIAGERAQLVAEDPITGEVTEIDALLWMALVPSVGDGAIAIWDPTVSDWFVVLQIWTKPPVAYLDPVKS